MSFGKFLLYVVLFFAAVAGLLLSACGAIFVVGSGNDRNLHQLALAALIGGILLVAGAVWGWRALRKRAPPP